MPAIILALIIITISGASLATYLFGKEERILVRLAMGNIIGSAIFALSSFILASFFGLSFSIVIAALLIAAIPLILLKNKEIRASLKPSGKSLDFPGIIYYSFFAIIFYFFFDKAMIERPQGIFIGASQNLGDLPYHLGAIFSFTEGQNFPPENPSFSGARFSYPFFADLIAACFHVLGAGVRNAMLWQNISLAFSLLLILENFAAKFTANRLAGKIAPFLLFFCGGLGFIWFARDYWNDGRGFFEFISNLNQDYTIRSEGFRFGNSLTTLFITQRSLLFGMPLALIAITHLWQVFSAEGSNTGEEPSSEGRNNLIKSFLIGLLAGGLPLIHLHSLAVLFILAAFIFFFRLDKWKEWVSFGTGVSIIAIPELAWAMSGTANRAGEFFSWHFGWDSGKVNILWFYFKNFGLFMPILLASFLLLGKVKDNEAENIERGFLQNLFYLPFAACFLIANIFKLAPWEWDNIKVLIYWFLGSIPFIALAIAYLWQSGKLHFRIIGGAFLFLLIASGGIDVWRVISGAINYQVFDKDAIKIAEQIKAKLPPRALFLNAPTYNSPVVLSGRRSLMRYNGHLQSHGIDYSERENDLKRIYSGEGTAEILLKKYEIEYILIGPEEISALKANYEYFEKYPAICESGAYKIYQIKK